MAAAHIAASAPHTVKGIRETTAAAEFWGKFVPEGQRLAFQGQLAQLFVQDFQKHWHEAEPHRGSAFRSIKCDGYGVDSKLQKAMATAGISLEATTFPPSVVMWVNPGEVKVRYGKSWSSKIVFSDSEFPARKMYHPLALQMQVEPTILCSDESDYASSDFSSDSSYSSGSESPMSTPPTSPTISPRSETHNMVPQYWKSGQEFVPQRSRVHAMPVHAMPVYA
jgi:hypothetical protein